MLVIVVAILSWIYRLLDKESDHHRWSAEAITVLFISPG